MEGGAFASFGLPTVNAVGDSAFLGTLKVSRGVATPANARGIFANFLGSNPQGPTTYEKIARVGDPAGDTGGSYSVLKDPVLNGASDLAFQATLAGRPVAGLATTTIWWQPTTATLPTLLAQGGKRPGLPSDYWPSPFASEQDARDANGGALPPDWSVLAKARGAERPFPQWLFDYFTT